MRKLTLFLLATMLAFGFKMNAQQFVSTEPTNRNVIIEEFTGRNCQFCPGGHRVSNEIMAAHPGRVWAVNLHCTSLSPTTYPNLNCSDGHTLANGFNFDGIPTGVVNRSSNNASDTGQWSGMSNTQMSQVSECNVAGRVCIDQDTRVATITVEVYYTGNSTADENYLTVAMLQDSIFGSQVNGSSNPSQWINGQYCHMHVLRDVITPTWGESISPTTQGTLITKTYEYPIPETIGSPNGVEVVLNHIFFLAWVSERYQGTPTRPILNACKLEKLFGVNVPLYPSISHVAMASGTTCSQSKEIEVEIMNIGTETLTSMTINSVFDGITQTINWEGELPRFATETFVFPVTAPFGIHDMTINIVQVNGESFNASYVYPVNCLEWIVLDVDGNEEELKLILVQDKWGAQTTWSFVASDGTILALGGPYSTLPAANGTQVHVEKVTVPANECVKFIIRDSEGNGICCTYGNGYYQIKDSKGNLLVDGDGDFGNEANHLFSINSSSAVQVITEEPQLLSDTRALFIGSLTGQASEVGFIYKKLVDPTPNTVQGELNGSSFTALVEDLKPNTMYSVKAFAVIGNETVYGQEQHFHTWTEGVSELEQSLRVYPNPANDYLMVEGVMTSVEVYNTVGQCLLSRTVNENNTRINLTSFDNGIYFLRVNNNGEVVTRKFSVNR